MLKENSKLNRRIRNPGIYAGTLASLLSVRHSDKSLSFWNTTHPTSITLLCFSQFFPFMHLRSP